MIENHLLFLFGLLAASYLFAKVEVHIEGPDGWAAKLPTWHIENQFTKYVLGKRPLTGYHFYLMLFMITVFHLPYLLGLVKPSLHAEFRIMSFLIFFWIIEDFLWFIVNPAFGLRKFKKEYIWWHAKSWLWFMPREYYIFIPLGLLLYFYSI